MDFYPVMMNITFSPDSQSSLISIEIINDSEIETNETFTLALTSFSPGVSIDTPNATVTIVDDDSNKNIIYDTVLHVVPTIAVNSRHILCQTTSYDFVL
jgi:hypothetical protein